MTADTGIVQIESAYPFDETVARSAWRLIADQLSPKPLTPEARRYVTAHNS